MKRVWGGTVTLCNKTMPKKGDEWKSIQTEINVNQRMHQRKSKGFSLCRRK